MSGVLKTAIFNVKMAIFGGKSSFFDKFGGLTLAFSAKKPFFATFSVKNRHTRGFAVFVKIVEPLRNSTIFAKAVAVENFRDFVVKICPPKSR